MIFYIGTFRLRKRARNTVHGKDKRVPKEEQCIFENHHPAIIDKATLYSCTGIKRKSVIARIIVEAGEMDRFRNPQSFWKLFVL